MEILYDFILEHKVLTTIIPLTLFVIAIFGFILRRKKFRIDKKIEDQKKVNFSLYLEDNFRIVFTKNKNLVYLIYKIVITNHSKSNFSLTSTLNVKYLSDENNNYVVSLKHQSSFFKDIKKLNYKEFDSVIRLEETGIKSGWIIFKSPNELKNVRIRGFEIIFTDSNGNSEKINASLMKNISYEN